MAKFYQNPSYNEVFCKGTVLYIHYYLLAHNPRELLYYFYVKSCTHWYHLSERLSKSIYNKYFYGKTRAKSPKTCFKVYEGIPFLF